MAKVTIEIKDDNGKVLKVKHYELSSMKNLSDIENEVEILRKKLLPNLTKDLFEQTQKAYKKK